jgi:hypothetical protein
VCTVWKLATMCMDRNIVVRWLVFVALCACTLLRSTSLQTHTAANASRVCALFACVHVRCCAVQACGHTHRCKRVPCLCFVCLCACTLLRSASVQTHTACKPCERTVYKHLQLAGCAATLVHSCVCMLCICMCCVCALCA